jgi:hypothetical protein
MKPVLTKREEIKGLRLGASQPESAKEFLAFLDDLRERIVAAVLEADRVRSRLDGCRFAVVAADYREDKGAREGRHGARLAEIGLYDYDADVLLVAVVDPVRGRLLELEEREGVQPPISSEELAEAKKIAARATGESLRSRRIVAFPTATYRLSEERERRRCCTLYVPVRGARDGSVEIVVDLSRRELVPANELRPEPPSDEEAY